MQWSAFVSLWFCSNSALLFIERPPLFVLFLFLFFSKRPYSTWCNDPLSNDIKTVTYYIKNDDFNIFLNIREFSIDSILPSNTILKWCKAKTFKTINRAVGILMVIYLYYAILYMVYVIKYFESTKKNHLLHNINFF